MVHHAGLISTVAVSFALATLFGFGAHKLRLPPLVGYLVAGLVLGSYTPGFVADTEMSAQLAEMGVMLLMFGVGLHFSAADLLAVRWIAIPGAILQIILATALGLGVTYTWGWSIGAGLVMGLSLSVASTVVLLKALEETNAVATPNGRVAVGWLIVEDLAMVLVLVLLPAFATALGGQSDVGDGAAAGNLFVNLALALGKVAAFVVIALLFGPRALPWILRQVARLGSRELFTLSVLAISLGIAFGAARLFGVSFALGAFFAGVVVSESDLSHRAAANSLPLQDAFAVLFFVSVGMLFDPTIILRQPLHLLAVLGVIVLGKSVIALLVVLALRYPLTSALTIAASLAQIGEFSFILAGLGLVHHLLPAEGLSLILGGSILSITLNPLIMAGANRLITVIKKSPALTARFDAPRGNRFPGLVLELENAKRRAEEKARLHPTFTPQELADRFPLFKALTPEQRETLVLHFQPLTVEPGQRIIRVGDKADAVYFVSSGQVEVAIGARKIKLEAGSFFGEMALLSGQPRSADVTALDFTKLLRLSQGDFREFLRKYPDIRAQMEHLAAWRDEMNRFSDEAPTSSDRPAGTA